MRYTEEQSKVLVDMAFKAINEVKAHAEFEGCSNPTSFHNAVWGMLAMMDGKEPTGKWDVLALDKIKKESKMTKELLGVSLMETLAVNAGKVNQSVVIHLWSAKHASEIKELTTATWIAEDVHMDSYKAEISKGMSLAGHFDIDSITGVIFK